MERTEISEIFHKLDHAKHKLASEGYPFDFKMMLPSGDFLHTGIGTPAQMTMLALIQIGDVYKKLSIINEKEIPIEEFAETVKKRLIEFLDYRTISFGEDDFYEQ